jgi:hypothetical protein
LTHFLRLVDFSDKESLLRDEAARIRAGEQCKFTYNLRSDAFNLIPGSPFAYWVSDRVRELFRSKKSSNFLFKPGIASGDDFRFLRSWWENKRIDLECVPIAKGGDFSPFYQDLDLVFRNKSGGREFLSFDKCQPRNMSLFGRPGITWPFRTAKGLNTRILPNGCAFTIQGMAGFDRKNDPGEILFLLGVTNSTVFKQLLLLSVGAFAFQAGAMSLVPIPIAMDQDKISIAKLANQIWKEKYRLDSINETSHAFSVPYAVSSWDMEVKLRAIDELYKDLDQLVYKLYDLHDEDRAAIERLSKEFEGNDDLDEIAASDDEAAYPGCESSLELGATLSWAIGVAFGRFDLRLATGERETAPEPDPFDPLPAKSPGMLSDGAAPFHTHTGILVDDQGHPHDLPRLIEGVLGRVDVEVPGDVRRWLQRDFFPLHLKQYSKSRRKAPIYWSLSTISGSYTLWLYYPSLTSQTLYTAVNDFVEPKLKQVSRDIATLRDKGTARSHDDEKTFEALQALELELIELRDTLLQIAPTYHPNHDDGVQITAAPLWQLFRHTAWQQILKDTWAKLEKGDYDWAHLAMAYWPTRVREKCKTDKSLAIARDLEHLYVEPEPKAANARGRKKEAE